MQASPKVNERSITAATESAETVLFSNDMNPHLPPLVQDQEEEEEEFSFLCTNPSGSLISADDIFQNGQIRPIFPLFNRDGGPLFIDEDKAAAAAAGGPLMFVEERNEADGPSCVWTRGSKALPDQQMCKKSNSTGFSKLRRFREFVLRSNSDGKDAFVFLNHKDSTSKHLQETITTTAAASEMKGHEKTTAKKDVVAEKRKEQSSKRVSSSSSSAHELHYLNPDLLQEVARVILVLTSTLDLCRHAHVVVDQLDRSAQVKDFKPQISICVYIGAVLVNWAPICWFSMRMKP